MEPCSSGNPRESSLSNWGKGRANRGGQGTEGSQVDEGSRLCRLSGLGKRSRLSLVQLLRDICFTCVRNVFKRNGPKTPTHVRVLFTH